MSPDLEMLRQQVKDGRREFASDVDGIFAEMKDYTASILPAIGEVSHDEALSALQQVTMKAFQRARERRL